MYMKKIDELIASNTKLAELLKKKEEPEKKCNTLVWVLAIIGAVAAVAAIAYAVYRYMNQDCLDDFDFEDDDFEDDFEDEEEAIVAEEVEEEKAEEPTETEE